MDMSFQIPLLSTFLTISLLNSRFQAYSPRRRDSALQASPFWLKQMTAKQPNHLQHHHHNNLPYPRINHAPLRQPPQVRRRHRQQPSKHHPPNSINPILREIRQSKTLNHLILKHRNPLPVNGKIQLSIAKHRIALIARYRALANLNRIVNSITLL